MDDVPGAEAGPLSGIRVVAIEHSVAGPLCSRILAELGADVIKIERPGVGDFARHWDGDVKGESGQFWWLNRFKRSVTLDLKTRDGKADLFALLEDADVLVHNLAPASAERLGLQHAGLQQRFPRLVNCQISGYGAAGPRRDRKAYDMLIQAEAGIMSLTGTPDQPMRVGVSISDVTTGIYSALVVLAAVYERNRTGRGRYLDMAMFDVVLEFLGPMLLSYLNAEVTYPRIPDHHHAIVPYGVVTCSDGERILIAIEQDAEWRRFCSEVLEDDELATADEFATNTKRARHRQELYELVVGRLAQRSSEEVIEAMNGAALAYGRLNDIDKVAEHEVVAYRGVLREGRTHGGDDVVRLAGIAERLFGGQAIGRDRPPRLGEDGATVPEWRGKSTSTQGRSSEGLHTDGG